MSILFKVMQLMNCKCILQLTLLAPLIAYCTHIDESVLVPSLYFKTL